MFEGTPLQLRDAKQSLTSAYMTDESRSSKTGVGVMACLTLAEGNK
jgi:hypothetical protein